MTPEEQKALEEEAKAALEAKKQADLAAEAASKQPAPPTQPPAPQAPPQDDPMLVEYADLLKAQLGNLYDKAYDKLPLKERIATCKIAKATMDKMPSRGEGKPPVGPGIPTQDKPTTPMERYSKGINPITAPRLSSSFGVTTNKK